MAATPHFFACLYLERTLVSSRGTKEEEGGEGGHFHHSGGGAQAR